MLQLLKNSAVELLGKRFEGLKKNVELLDIDMRKIILAVKTSLSEQIVEKISGKDQEVFDAEALRTGHELKISARTQQKKVIFLRKKHDIVLTDLKGTFLNMFECQKIGIDAPHMASVFHFRLPYRGTPEKGILRLLRQKGGMLPLVSAAGEIGTSLLFHLKTDRNVPENGDVGQRFHSNKNSANIINVF